MSFFKKITGKNVYEEAIKGMETAKSSVDESIALSHEIIKKMEALSATVESHVNDINERERKLKEMYKKVAIMYKKITEAQEKSEASDIKSAKFANVGQQPSAKEIANLKKEPYVAIVSIDVDPHDITVGSFELDWNDIFVARLVKAGYEGATDAEIVDSWFQFVCMNIVSDSGTLNNIAEFYATMR